MKWSQRQLDSVTAKAVLLGLHIGAVVFGIWLGRLLFDAFT